MENIKKAILSEATKLYSSLPEEEALEKINLVVEDAIKEEPETEDGKKVRELALTATENGIKSPYATFDYNQLRDETTFEAVKSAFAILAKYQYLVFPMKADDETRKKISDDYNACALEMFSLLNEKNVGLEEYKVFFGSLGAIIKSLEQYVGQQVEGHTSEIMSRMLGAKNPGTQKFDKAYASYKDLIELLEKVRKDTGDKLEDYFNIEKHEN